MLKRHPRRFLCCKAWCDNCQLFSSSQFLYNLKAFKVNFNIQIVVNFTEPGEGKSDVDRHFGLQVSYEKNYLLKHNTIVGLPGYIAVWKDIQHMTCVIMQIDRNSQPKFVPSFQKGAVGTVYQCWYSASTDNLKFRQVI